MIIGVLIGTYSSIFVASALAIDIHVWWERRKAAKAHAAGTKGKTAKGKTKPVPAR
jgi:preprotein translocase subunit SecF